MTVQACSRSLASLLLILITVSAAQQANPAVEQFHALRTELRKSQTNGDWHSYLAAANKLKELLNDRPDSLLEVARGEVRVGDNDAALRELEQFARMGQSADLPAASPDFAALLKNPNYTKLEDKMNANRNPVSLGSTAFLLSDPSLLAEDVDYDPGTKRFFITSIREKKII